MVLASARQVNNMNSRFVIGMMKRLLILELKGKINLDHKQTYKLLVALGIRGPLANDTSKEVVLFTKQCCRRCGAVSSNEVGSPFIFVSICTKCAGSLDTYYSYDFRKSYAIAATVIDLPADLRKELHSQLIEELEDGLWQSA